jgi:hypothetical protein
VRRLVLVAALLVGTLAFGVRPAAAAGLSGAGWWWKAQTGAATLPAPPTVPPGGLMVAADPSGPTAIAALQFDLEPNEGVPVLTLALASGGNVNADAAIIVACPSTTAWTSSYVGTWDSRPDAECARAVTGTRSADGSAYTFALSPFLAAGKVNVVLQPGAGPVFQLTFNAPSDAALKTSPVAPASTPSSAPELSAEPETFDAPAIDFGGTPLEFSPSAPAFVPDEQALDVATGAPARPIAGNRTGVVAASKPPRGSALALLLLLAVGGAAWAFSNMPTPAVRALGPMTHSDTAEDTGRAAAGPAAVGGLGRFARPRHGPPPRL